MSKIKTILFILSFYPIYLLVKLLTLFFTIIQIKQWFPKKMRSVLYFENFPIENAGYQYRAKKWSDILNTRGFYSKVKTTVKDKTRFEQLISKQFSYFLIRSSIIRLFQILSSFKYEAIVVRRELLQYNDYGNLFMEKLLFSIHKNITLDFDDDIASAKNEGRAISCFGKLLFENTHKFSRSISMYNKFFVCSEWHINFIKTLNTKALITIIPTCIDYDNLQAKIYNLKNNTLNIGWIGSTGNQKHLELIIEPLNNITKSTKIILHIISGSPYKNTNARFNIINYKWSMCTQIKNMHKFDLGIMPLLQTKVVDGKCGFKLLQYMGLGIVGIASAIGVNKEIITQGKNGYLVNNNDDWEKVFREIISNRNQLPNIGKKARETVLKSYSFRANINNYLNSINK